MGFFGAAQGWGDGGVGGGTKKALLPKIYHTYPTMMKLGTEIPYLQKIQKYMNHLTHPLRSAEMSNFSPEISEFCYIKKYMYRLQFDTKFLIILTFLQLIKMVLIKRVTILTISAKMATSGLLKIRLEIVSMIQNEVRKFSARFIAPAFTKTHIYGILFFWSQEGCWKP